MITYKFFRDKFFVLSDKPVLSPFGTVPIFEQTNSKPVGLWFSKGLQWLNLVLNSHHGLYTGDSNWTNKTLFLHQIDINWEHLLQINNEKDAVKLSGEFANNIDFTIWYSYLEQHPELYGFYCKLNDKYNIEKYSRRGSNYSKNTERTEERNIELFKNMVTKYITNHHPDVYDIVTRKELENYYMWYPILSVSSGCIWDDRAINFDKCKLIMEIPEKLLIKCQRSDNSIKTLLRYINQYNMIENDVIPESVNNNILHLPRLYSSNNNNIGSRTRKSGSAGKRHSSKAHNKRKF